MAILSDAELLERVVKPRNKQYIDLAVLQEQRLLLHAEATLEKYNLPFQAFNNFTLWWKSLISSVKYNRIEELLNCPIFTVGIVKDIFDQLQKFLDAQDRYIDFQFVSEDYTNDYNDFLSKQNDDTFWRQNVISELKTGICSFVVVDLPSKQNGERPEPYNYFVSPRLIKDVDVNKYSNKVEFIIYKQSDFYWDPEMSSVYTSALLNILQQNTEIEKMICIDDKSYRVLIKPKSTLSGWNTGKNEWVIVSDTAHDLGYCPCIDFWKDSIKGTNGLNKIGPITLQLSNLDYILFFKACIDYMNLYGPFPVMVAYDMRKNEWDDKTKEVITETSATNQGAINPISNSQQTQDPRTSGRDFIGPGGGVMYPVPEREDDFDPMKSDPFKFVGMDVESVELANKLLEKMEAFIKEKCTGTDEEYLNEIAKNAEMIAASFRKEETILTWIKSNIERVHTFVTKTKCELRYGVEYFKGCTINYGRDYLLKDATTLSKEFKESVDNGMPPYYSDEIAETAINTRFKNNPEKLARFRIIRDIIPYSDISFADMQLLGINTSDVDNFIVRVNSTTFVNRFELECGDIVNFGSAIPYPEKIKIIQSKLSEYGKGIKWTEVQPAASKSLSNSNT